MPKYTYTAKKGPSEIVKGEIEAPSHKNAINMIEAMGLFPVNVATKESAPRQESVRNGKGADKNINMAAKIHALSPGTVGSRNVDTFMWQMASLFKSSVPLLRSLSLVENQTESKRFKVIIKDLATQIKRGSLFSDALSRYPAAFNNFIINMIKAGEKSGTLDEVLNKLVQHREKESEMRRKVQSALAYPVLVIVVGIGTIFVMLTYFLPKLTKLFDGMKQELPLPTKILMAVSGFMSAYWYLFVIAAFFIAVVIIRSRRSGKKKAIIDSFLLRIPPVKKFIITVQTARLARALGVLLKNGIPVYESLGLAANTLDNEVIKNKVEGAARHIVEHGCTLSESFRRAGVFPEFTISMIAVGEEGGKLEESLSEIASSYEKEVDQSIKIMTSMLEPILILIVGGFVGLIVFAMLLPILNMGGLGS